MAQNLASPDSHEIPLTVLGGLVTYVDPTSLPQGVSPDCRDMQFNPGSTFTRDGFRKVFPTPFGNATVTAGYSYTDPKGIIRNLFLDSAGNLWVENLSASPETYTLLATVAPGSYAKFTGAFGRVYIAITDGLHGSDVPLQYDGTNIDRVTQDGPGSSPDIISLALPSVSLVDAGAPPTLTITGIFPTNKVTSGVSFYTAISVFTTTSVSGITEGQNVTISGTTGSVFLGTYVVLGFPGDGSVLLSAFVADGTPAYIGTGTLTIGSGSGTSLVRNNNIVTAVTTTPHQLQVGNQAQIANVPASAVGGGIATVVINNEDNPGIATVTTNSAHGLIPGLFVSLVGIAGTAVGGGATSAIRAGRVVTVTTASAHNLTPGAIITTSSFSTGSFNTTAQVLNVTGPNVFTFAQADTDATESSGVVTLNWPIPDTTTPTFFEVIAAPTKTTFQVDIDYSDGSWTGGTVTYGWDGKFYVKTVISPTSFTYQQYGPNASATYSAASTVTPFGQAAPGFHQMQVFFQTRNGAQTAPSPPVQFIANGGQYYSVSNIPIGPPNTVARVIAFTGAQGAYFFYIPTTPQVNGQIVGTSTVINDNTTTQAVFDFGDPTLFAATGISIQGNNLANQIVLDGAQGFGFYGSRLDTYGQRNVVDNFLNMGFNGGYLPSTVATYGTAQPTGWTVSGATPGQFVFNAHFGEGYQFTVVPSPTGGLLQSAFEDYLGDPILQPNTLYRLRVWIKTSAFNAGVNFVALIRSVSTGFSSTATITGSQISTVGGFAEAVFTLKTPISIPSDMLLNLFVSSSGASPNVTINNVNLIYEDEPYKLGMLSSYVNNAEGMDGVSGVIGPVEDTHPVMDLFIIRENLYMLTRDPGGRLHQTAQAQSEPSGWVVDEVGQNCGVVSTFGLTVSQANDDTGGGGEEWAAWYSSSGPRIFGGEFPFKIAQEIMRRKGRVAPGAPNDLTNLNPAAQTTVWALNDPEQKIMYFGVPMNSATAPNVIWMLNYLGCETAEEIANANPVHRAINSGKMISNDLGRKWSPWQLPINGAALMFREGGYLEPVFFGGNGLTPNSSPIAAFGNVYTLDPNLLADDDYGVIGSYYTTSPFPDADLAQALGIGGGLKMCSYAYGLISGTGTLAITVLFNLLSKVWRIAYASTTQAPLQVDADNDTEFGCGQATGKRFWFRFSATPKLGSNDSGFELNSWAVAIKKNARMPVRGSNRT